MPIPLFFLRQQFLGAGFHNWRSTIQNPLWLNESMPSPQSTLAAVFPLLLTNTSISTNGSVVGSRDDLDRWLFLTQALQSHCLALSIEVQYACIHVCMHVCMCACVRKGVNSQFQSSLPPVVSNSNFRRGCCMFCGNMCLPGVP